MPQTILLVEDEPGIAESAIYALKKEGFEVVHALTGALAMQAAEKKAFDLALVDVGLPDTSGFDLARTVSSRFNLPFVFVTARAEEIDRVAGLELGADDYITKPFSPRELVARVRAILRRITGDTPQKNKSGSKAAPGFTINESRYEILYFGSPLVLTKLEFKLLSILVKSPGRVFTREHLMALAWDVPEMSLERTVDAHVKTVRQKLRAVKEDADPIVTHRGIGYSMKDE